MWQSTTPLGPAAAAPPAWSARRSVRPLLPVGSFVHCSAAVESASCCSGGQPTHPIHTSSSSSFDAAAACITLLPLPPLKITRTRGLLLFLLLLPFFLPALIFHRLAARLALWHPIFSGACLLAAQPAHSPRSKLFPPDTFAWLQEKAATFPTLTAGI